MFETILIFREMNDLLEMLQKTKNCVFCCQFFLFIWSWINCGSKSFAISKKRFGTWITNSFELEIKVFLKGSNLSAGKDFSPRLKSTLLLKIWVLYRNSSEIWVVWLLLCFKYEWCNMWSQNTKTSFRNAQDKFIEQLQNYFMTRVSQFTVWLAADNSRLKRGNE